jgi:hypothetical protein
MPLSFTSFNGYVPIMQMTNALSPNQNFFYHTRRDDRVFIQRSVKNLIQLDAGLHASCFKTPNHSLMEMSYNQGKDFPSIMTGFMSVLMIKENGNYTEKHFVPSKEIFKREFRLMNEIDIMVLGLYDKSKINEITSRSTLRGWFDIFLNPAHIKLLISEKLGSTKWMKANYSTTIKKHIQTNLDKVIHNYNLPYEIVSNDELKQYTRIRSTIKTNSLMEIMKIDQEIKDDVFQKVKLENLFV